MSARRISLSAPDLGVFFDDRHAALAKKLTSGALEPLAGLTDPMAVAQALALDLGLSPYLVPESLGGAPAGQPESPTYIDVRSLVLIREALGHISPLADALFAVQGLGTYPIVLAGNDDQKSRYLPGLLAGERIAAFALTEPEAGSDAGALQTTAVKDGSGWVLSGEKTLISNAPVAHHYVVFANADPSAGRKGITAFVVDADAPGLSAEAIGLSIPHPIGKLRFNRCFVPGSALLGEVGRGFRLAMETLDAFRISVGAAANGMAAMALSLAAAHVRQRKQFGAPLADQQIVKAYLADMATELDAARLLVARAAHLRDTAGGRISGVAAMGKMFATEAAQRIIDLAVQLHGGVGVVDGSFVELLYRAIRPLRIYEGATEIQKLIIAKDVLDRAAEGRS
ncbi:MAG: acyl-CoA dehydrogenase family protein [Polyangiaceae bacterium]|nr:acyl-CoA dehydrogenase family protein [Polyangiaceae bacterium]